MDPSDSRASDMNPENEPEKGPGGRPSPSENPGSAMAAQEEPNWEENEQVEWLEVPEGPGSFWPLDTPQPANEDEEDGALDFEDTRPEIQTLVDFLCDNPDMDIPLDMTLEIQGTNVTVINPGDERWMPLGTTRGAPILLTAAKEQGLLAGLDGLDGQELATPGMEIMQRYPEAWEAVFDRMYPLPEVNNQIILDGLYNTTVDTLGGDGSPHGPLECSICLESYLSEQALVVLPRHPCHHFHRSCLEDWLKNNTTCPPCRNLLSSLEDPSD